jgi:hypothetical protein
MELVAKVSEITYHDQGVIVETETNSETSDINSIWRQLITREDFIYSTIA